MQKRGRGRGQDAHGAQDDEGAVEAHDKAVVALGALLQAVGDGLQEHQLAQAVGGNRDVGNFPGNGRAVADGNADVGGGQGGGVVDAVAQHDDGVPGGLLLLNKVGLVLGQDLGVVAVHADLLRNDRRGAVIVAGHHDGLADAKAAQLFQNLGGFLAQRVGDADDTGQHTADSQIQMGIFRRQRVKFAALARRNAAALVLKDKVLAADNGLLAADLAGNAVGDDVLHLAVHLVVADALCGSGLHDGVRHRVGVVLLQTGRDL